MKQINMMKKLYWNKFVQRIQSYGLIPEFIGRVPIVANLETLDVAALKIF